MNSVRKPVGISEEYAYALAKAFGEIDVANDDGTHQKRRADDLSITADISDLNEAIRWINAIREEIEEEGVNPVGPSEIIENIKGVKIPEDELVFTVFKKQQPS